LSQADQRDGDAQGVTAIATNALRALLHPKANSRVDVQPGDNLRPDLRVRLLADKDCQMLEPDDDLACMLNETRTFPSGMASMNGLTDAAGAISSAALTTTSVGARRDDGPTVFIPIDSVPVQKRFSR
jgi:hypothetical protein